MQISDVRKRVRETIERARRAAAERRARIDQASHDYDRFLERVAIPVWRQAANVLRAEGQSFDLSTPAGSVRLVSDRAGNDYVELELEADGVEPQVIVHTRRTRGRRVLETERPLAPGIAIADLGEEEVLAGLLEALAPLVVR